MANNYSISLGIGLNNSDLNNIRSQISSLESNPINLRFNDRAIQSQINNIRQQLQGIGNISLNVGIGNVNGGSGNSNNIMRNISNNMSQITTTTNNAQHTIQRLRHTLASAKFDNASIDIVTQHLQEMDIAVTNVESRIRHNRLRLNITGIDEVGRTVTILKEMNLATGQITNIGKNINQSFVRTREEARQVNEAYKEMKSLIKEIGNTAISINRANEAGQSFEALEQKMIALQDRYEELRLAFSGGFDNNQTRNLANGWEDVAHNVNVANEAMANTSASRNLQRSLNELESTARRIGELEVNIARLDGSSNANEISALENQLNSLRHTYDELVADFSLNNTNLSVGDMQSVNAVFAETEDILERLRGKLADTRANLARGIQINLADNTFSKQVKQVEIDAKKLSSSSKSIDIGINNVKDALNDMRIAASTGDIEGLIAANERYERQLKSVKNQLDINARTEKNNAANQKLIDDRHAFQSKIDAWLTKNSAAAKKFGSQLLELKAQSQSCDRVTLNHLEKELKQIDKQAEAAGLKMQSFGDRLKTQFAKYSSYFSVASLFLYGIQAGKSMFEQVKSIDSAMTELKKVTDETTDSYNKFLTSASSKAKEIGTTIDGLVSSTADFARLGYGFEDSQKLAEVANIYAVVGDEIDGVEAATESLISTMTAFGVEASNSMSIVDKFNEVGNNFAISSGGIGEALERSASSMAAANNTLDETIALITAANTVVQDADSVGRLMPTIKMAISVKLQRWTRPR